MSRDLCVIRQEAIQSGLAPSGSVILPVFGKNMEPESKIDLLRQPSLFIPIRKFFSESKKTSLLTSKINMGGNGMANYICEAALNHTLTPFTEADVFFRIAARVDDYGDFEKGTMKLAVKSLSGSSYKVNGVAQRSEFELLVPEDMSLEDAIPWFFAQYKAEYGVDTFDAVRFNNLKPIGCYMSARTGAVFLHHMDDIITIGEACEDLKIAVGPDLTTALDNDINFPEAHIEWEIIGSLYHGPRSKQPSADKLVRIGQKSMRVVTSKMLQFLWPNERSDFYDARLVKDSKAEEAVKRTMLHDCFMPMYHDCNCDFNINAQDQRACLNHIVSNADYLADIIHRPDVVNARIRMARKLEATREAYNDQAPENLTHNQSFTLAA